MERRGMTGVSPLFDWLMADQTAFAGEGGGTSRSLSLHRRKEDRGDVPVRSGLRPWRTEACESSRLRASLEPFSGWTRRGPARSASVRFGSASVG